MLRSGSSGNEGGCQTAGLLNTTFNDARGSYLFSGIMFSVRTKQSPITIETLEIDVDTERGAFGSRVDLETEIFTYKGPYSGIMNNPSEWTLVTKTTPVQINSRPGVLVPVNDFNGVQMAANELRSFYIAMKGSYLDNRAFGLDKPGDLDQELGEVLTLFTGIGMQSRFAETPDRTVAPKFTGIIHYTEQSSCGSTSVSIVKTVVDFQLDIEATDVEDVIQRSDQALSSYLSKKMSEGKLAEYVSKFSLRRVGDLYTTGFYREGVCRFSPCTRITTGLTLEHSTELDSDLLEATVLAKVDDLARSLQKALELRVDYSGSRASSATFDIEISGVPTSTKMNGEQTEYFRSILGSFISSRAIKVYDVTVTEQKLLENNSLRISGEIDGVDTTPGPDGFADAVEATLRDGEIALIAQLKLEYLLTPRLKPDDTSFFDDLTNADATLQAILPPTMQPSVSPTSAPNVKDDPSNLAQNGINAIKDKAQSASVNSPVLVGAIVSGFVIMACLIFLCCRHRHFESMRNKKFKKSEKSEGAPILQQEPKSDGAALGRSASTASTRSISPSATPSRSKSGVVRPQSPSKFQGSSASLDFSSLWSVNENIENTQVSRSQRIARPNDVRQPSTSNYLHRSVSFDSTKRPRSEVSKGPYAQLSSPVKLPAGSPNQTFRSQSQRLARSNDFIRRGSNESFRSQGRSEQNFRSQSQRLSRSNDALFGDSNDDFRSQSQRMTRSAPIARNQVTSRPTTMRTQSSFALEKTNGRPGQQTVNVHAHHTLQSPEKSKSQHSQRSLDQTPGAATKSASLARPSPIRRVISDDHPEVNLQQNGVTLIRAQSSLGPMSPNWRSAAPVSPTRQRMTPVSPQAATKSASLVRPSPIRRVVSDDHSEVNLRQNGVALVRAQSSLGPMSPNWRSSAPVSPNCQRMIPVSSHRQGMTPLSTQRGNLPRSNSNDSHRGLSSSFAENPQQERNGRQKVRLSSPTKTVNVSQERTPQPQYELRKSTSIHSRTTRDDEHTTMMEPCGSKQINGSSHQRSSVFQSPTKGSMRSGPPILSVTQTPKRAPTSKQPTTPNSFRSPSFRTSAAGPSRGLRRTISTSGAPVNARVHQVPSEQI